MNPSSSNASSGLGTTAEIAEFDAQKAQIREYLQDPRSKSEPLYRLMRAMDIQALLQCDFEQAKRRNLTKQAILDSVAKRERLNLGEADDFA